MNIDRRIFGLDLLRGSAIVWVLLAHSIRYFVGLGGIVESVVEHVYFFGFMGVECFFVLSGFLIGQILLRDFGHNPDRKALLHFWVRRWLRTLPAYYSFLVIYFTLDLIQGRPLTNPLPYAFFVQNLLWPAPHFFGQSWSLAVEEWFYLLFPAVMALLYRWRRNTPVSMLGTALCLGTLSLVLRVIFLEQNPEWTWRYQVGKISLFRFDAIMLGILLALAKDLRPRMYQALARPWAVVLGLVLLLATRVLAEYEAQWIKIFILIAGPIAFSFILPYLEGWRRVPARGGKVMVYLSVWSYSIYLVNNLLMPVGARLARYVFPSPSWSHALLASFIFVLLSLILGRLSYRYIEETGLRWREKHFATKDL